ncbi:hypothetical protein A2U01_0074682, partial [Trifolium medium]|nr:hypothetical protein [Trifolium medium]
MVAFVFSVVREGISLMSVQRRKENVLDVESQGIRLMRVKGTWCVSIVERKGTRVRSARNQRQLLG